MKLTVIAMEIPYPPIHGGRVDIWRRLQALKILGIEVQLICWTPQDPTPEEFTTLEQTVSDLLVLDYTGKTPISLLRRGLALLKYPLGITSRMVYGQRFQQLALSVQQFNPDLLVIDGFNASVLTRQLSKRLGIPFIIRSHNIEHQHHSALFNAAQGFHRISGFLTLNHLKNLEFSNFREALAFFDISIDDQAFWQEKGFKAGYFLPPLAESSVAKLSFEETATEQYDVVFLGNLNRDNNVAGIQWFLTDVVPLIQSKKSDLSVLIAGSSPTQSVIDACAKVPCVDLKINPKSASQIYATGKVLVNPVAVGGGVSIKSIDMLATGKPIVSLDKGIYGLPDSIKPLFHLASDAQSFAEQVFNRLSEVPDSQTQMKHQALIDEAFGLPRIKLLIQQLQDILESDQSKQLL